MPEELTIRIRAVGSEQVQGALRSIQSGLQQLRAGVTSVGKITPTLEAMANHLRQAGSALDDLGQSMRRWGTMATGIVAGAVGLVTKTFMDFETRLAEINTIARVSNERMQEVGKQIRQVAIESAQSLDTTSRAFYQILSAGVPLSQAMQVLRASAKLAAAGLAELEPTADAITTVLNAFRMSAGQASRVADVMFKTVELGKTTVPELAAQIGRVASTAAQAGISFEELSAAIATMTAAGVQTEITVSSLGQLLQNLLNPSKELTETLQQLGFSSGMALLQAKGLAGALQLLSQHVPKEKLAELVGSVEGLRAVMVLTGSQADKFVANLQEMRNATGAADRAFKTISETAGFQLKQALLSVQSAMVELGAAFAPALKKIAESIREVLQEMEKSGQLKKLRENLEQVADLLGENLSDTIEAANEKLKAFNNLSKETRQTIINWGMTIGPLVAGLGFLAGAIGNILNLLSKFISGVKWLVQFLPALVGRLHPFVAMGAIATPILAGEVRRALAMGEEVRKRQEQERQLREWLQKQTVSVQGMRVLTEEERQRRLEELNKMVRRAGVALMEEFSKGIRSAKERPAQAMDEALQKVRKRLPKSPPEEGPLKDIVEAGIKIPQLIAEGIRKGGQKAVEAMDQLAGHLMGIWSGWLRRFQLRGDIRVALARARGLPEETILSVERGAVAEQFAQTMRVLQRMRQMREKGVPITEEEILEVEREAAELQARLREIAQRQKELRYQRYLEEAEQARIEEERERLLQRELQGPPQPTPVFPPLEPLGDVERMAMEEAERAEREIEAFHRAQQEIERVLPELSGLPEVPPSVGVGAIFEEGTEDLRRTLEERARQLEAEAKIAELQAAIAKERQSPQATQLELEAIQKRIEALRAQQKVVGMERDATEARIKALEIEREIAELEAKAATTRTTKSPLRQGIMEATEGMIKRLPQVVSGRADLGEVMRDFVRDVQEQIAGELLKPLTEGLKKAMNSLANQISSAIGSLLSQLPTSLQLGVGGLALFGGLRPVTEAIEGVGKFITHTVGEVLKVFGIRIGGKKKASPIPAPVVPLGAAVYGPSINLNTAVTLQVDGRELGRVLVRQVM
ncbi:MAG: hypothetical protein SLRJCFUN_001762 [Candidatus Fervidibacter sp.]